LQAALGQPGPTAATYSDQLLGIENNLAPFVSALKYDQVGRLSSMDSGQKGILRIFDRTALQYAYDSAGNRNGSVAVRYLPTRLPTPANPFSPAVQPVTADLGEQAADGQTSLATNALTNRITTPGFVYDAAGNITRLPRKDGSALRLQYDGLGRLRLIQREGSTTFEYYLYNAANQISVARRSGSGLSTYFVRNGPSSATRFLQLSTSSPLSFSSTTIALAERKVARLSETSGVRTIEFLHSTPAGVLSTTPSQNAVASRGTAPFGSTATLNPSIDQFHSYERSSFGLDYAIYRHYDPEIGRFIQPDPLGESVFRLQDPQSLNLYAFVRNEPLNRRDLLGLNDCDAGGVATPTPDGGVYCTYAYGKTVYETIVRAGKGDTQSILTPWWPSNNMSFSGFGQAAKVSDQEQDGQEGPGPNRKTPKTERCIAANDRFIAAANAYVGISKRVPPHNAKIKSLQYQMVALGADAMENVYEQVEDFSPQQGASASVARTASAMSLKEEMNIAKFDQASLLFDQKAAIENMKAAAAARDAACGGR